MACAARPQFAQESCCTCGRTTRRRAGSAGPWLLEPTGWRSSSTALGPAGADLCLRGRHPGGAPSALGPIRRVHRRVVTFETYVETYRCSPRCSRWCRPRCTARGCAVPWARSPAAGGGRPAGAAGSALYHLPAGDPGASTGLLLATPRIAQAVLGRWRADAVADMGRRRKADHVAGPLPEPQLVRKSVSQPAPNGWIDPAPAVRLRAALRPATWSELGQDHGGGH